MGTQSKICFLSGALPGVGVVCLNECYVFTFACMLLILLLNYISHEEITNSASERPALCFILCDQHEAQIYLISVSAHVSNAVCHSQPCCFEAIF